MSDFTSIEIDFNNINKIAIGNIVNWNGHPYTIYDIEDKLIYIKTPECNNLGVPYDQIRPILLTDDVMKLCTFELVNEPKFNIVDDKVTDSKTSYRFINEEYGIDMIIVICVKYKWDDNDMFLVPNINDLDIDCKQITWLHQIQNIFYSFYQIHLIDIS